MSPYAPLNIDKPIEIKLAYLPNGTNPSQILFSGI